MSACRPAIPPIHAYPTDFGLSRTPSCINQFLERNTDVIPTAFPYTDHRDQGNQQRHPSKWGHLSRRLSPVGTRPSPTYLHWDGPHASHRNMAHTEPSSHRGVAGHGPASPLPPGHHGHSLLYPHSLAPGILLHPKTLPARGHVLSPQTME